MPWPSNQISTSNLDSGADSPAQARPDLLSAVTAINSMISQPPFGVDQTLQDMTSYRSAGVTYTNQTGKPMCVVIHGRYNELTYWAGLYIDDKLLYKFQRSSQGASEEFTITAIVLPSASYRYDGGFLGWVEYK